MARGKPAPMKLSEKEKKIISSIELQTNASVAQIAEETGYRSHVVRSTLSFLQDKGIITPHTCIVPWYLGLSVYGASFSYYCDTESDRQKLLALLLHSPKVSIAREVVGEYQYHVRLLVPKIEDLDEFFASISRTCRGYFSNKIVATWRQWTRFRHKFFSDHKSAVNAINFSMLPKEGGYFELDETDLLILRHLSSSPILPTVQLAQALKLPRTTVADRVKLLEENGVICGYGCNVAREKIGLHSYRLFLCVKQVDPAFHEDIMQFAQANPYIRQLVHCVGHWDYELGIRTDVKKQLPAIVQSIYSRYREQISSMKVLSVLTRCKLSAFSF